MRRALVGVVTLVGLIGCSVDRTLRVPEPETGPGLVYSMTFVNGRAVPLVLDEGPPKIELLKGALTLSPDSSWLYSTVLRITGQGNDQVTSSSQRGRYSRVGADLTLRLANLNTVQYVGTFDENAVTLRDAASPHGDQIAFRR